MIIDFDDFGASHIISDQTRSWDCREPLLQLKEINPAFKVTLFTIPGEVTMEILKWAEANKDWVELAYHGFFHGTNTECQDMSYEEFNELMHSSVTHRVMQYFVNGFKAPGWQISDDIYLWLKDNGYWVADQDYNTGRRPEDLPAYINRDGQFFAHKGDPKQDWHEVDAWHGHTWNCVGNGIYERLDELKALVAGTDKFRFVSEALK